MSESVAVPLIVVSSAREPVEAVNSLLRRQGIAARCTWISALNDLPDSLSQQQVELLLCVPAENLPVAEVASMGARTAPGLPLLAIRPQITEDILAADLAAGARDTINLTQPQRAHQVITRELHTWRLQRAHDEARDAVRASRKQLDSVLTRSNDAIIDVQEGILVEANQSWLELIGGADAEAVVGQPVMDAFHQDSHVALKGALMACLRGQWKDHALKVAARTTSGGSVPVELLLTLGERDGEPCVRVMVPIKKLAGEAASAPATATPVSVPAAAAKPVPAPTREATAAAGKPATGVPAAAVPAAATVPAPAARAAVAPAPAAVPARVATPAAAAQIPRVVPTLSPVDTTRDKPATAAPVTPGDATPTTGEPVNINDRARQYDAVWVKHIQAALAENRFRLVQQPITNLAGGAPMFDLLIRMLDRSRKEIQPKEFLPAAERNQLMSPIDRWVIGAAARFAAETKPGCLFVRLSHQSAVDEVLPRWLTAQVNAVKLDPRMLCLTVAEAVAMGNVEAVRRQALAIRSLGMRFAVEHFGTGPDPLGLLGAIPMDFVKIDGKLIQGVKGDSLVQSKVEALVEAARERNIESIAPNVEDANTMAVLWQLGVQHLEGYLIQRPEEVVLY